MNDMTRFKRRDVSESPDVSLRGAIFEYFHIRPDRANQIIPMIIFKLCERGILSGDEIEAMIEGEFYRSS